MPPKPNLNPPLPFFFFFFSPFPSLTHSPTHPLRHAPSSSSLHPQSFNSFPILAPLLCTLPPSASSHHPVCPSLVLHPYVIKLPLTSHHPHPALATHNHIQAPFTSLSCPLTSLSSPVPSPHSPLLSPRLTLSLSLSSPLASHPTRATPSCRIHYRTYLAQSPLSYCSNTSMI